MPRQKLTIVIVNWNVSDLLVNCLKSIKTHLNDLAFEVIVVDNASEDDSVAILKQDFAWVQLIENQENLGFAKANNQGFRQAKGKFVLILNPDTEIPANAIETMLTILEKDTSIGLIGPKITSENGAIVRACQRPNQSLRGIGKSLFLTDQLLDFLMRRFFNKTWANYADRRYFRNGTCACLQGSCMLMRRADLLQIGLFDERIPLYLDDNDLCQRFRNYGLSVYYTAEAEIVHHGGRSVARMENSRMSSMVGCLAIDMFFLKHGRRWQVLVYHFMLFASSVIFLLVDVILLPFLWFWKRPFIRNYLIKHFWSLIYSLTFRFKTKSLPKTWPRSLKEAWLAPENSLLSPPPTPKKPSSKAWFNR